jgi:hypothetical protein
VLDWFDATKIGLTATPALHTVDIFGKPVFTYSYREAVIDGYLVDQEPPIRITTALAQSGIHLEKGESVELIDTRSGKIDLSVLPDAVGFEVDQFNSAVVTKAFNRVLATELTRHIDLSLPDKTLVFAVSDIHADILVNELREAFREAYGEVEDAAIRKVTGSVDYISTKRSSPKRSGASSCRRTSTMNRPQNSSSVFAPRKHLSLLRNASAVQSSVRITTRRAISGTRLPRAYSAARPISPRSGVCRAERRSCIRSAMLKALRRRSS